MVNTLPSAPPTTLKVVAGLFFVYGLLGAYDILNGLAQGVLTPNPSALGLLIGPGLLRRSEMARVMGLAFCASMLVVTALAMVLFWVDRPPAVSIPLLGHLVGQLRGSERIWYVTGASLSYCALNLWQSWVLTRPLVRHQFGHTVKLR